MGRTMGENGGAYLMLYQVIKPIYGHGEVIDEKP